MLRRILVSFLMLSGVTVLIVVIGSDAFGAEGSIRLRRVAPAPRKTSDAMKTQKEIAARVKIQNDYYNKTAQLDAVEKKRIQLKADLEFARIADPDRINGLKKEIKKQDVEIKKLEQQIDRLHADLTHSLKRSPASVSRPIRRATK